MYSTFSGLLHSNVQKISYSLFSLSNKLDQTLWPYLIIQFLYIALSTLHVLLATYFEEEFLTHFYKVKGYANASYASHTDDMYFSKHSEFLPCQDVAKKIFKVLACCFKFVFIQHDCKLFLQELCTTVTRLVLPGELITDIPKEIHSIQCTDTTASYSDQCSTLLLHNHSDTTHHSSKANNYETACASNDDVNAVSEEVKQEAALLNSGDVNSDDAKQLQHLMILPKPTAHQLRNVNSLPKLPTTVCIFDNIYEKYQSNHVQLTQQNTTKDHW